MLRSFRIGGIHPPENKLSASTPIEVFAIPQRVVIPLSQHIGAPAVPCVAKGDRVRVGQLIGTAAGFVSANIHASVSGTVAAVDAVLDGSGVRKPAVTIDVEGDDWLESIDRTDTLIRECTMDSGQIIARIAECGIVGMGGATFPTQVKLSIPEGRTAEYLIINGVECEPYLTADNRVMIERGEEFLVGVSLLQRALGVKRAFIGIENNKPEAIANITRLASGFDNIEVVPLRTKYPQGGEKQLIDAVIGRQVPSGKLPIDVGAVVQNVGTALAVYEAVQKNKPLFERVVTVTGKEVKRPSNYKVRVGTPIEQLIRAVDADPAKIGKVINGGPMMGRAMSNPDTGVTKGTSGVLIFTPQQAVRTEPTECIKCAKCVEACPMALEPYIINRLSQLRRYADLEEHRVVDCIECGSCSYTCPAHLPLLDYIRVGKAEMMKIMRSRKK